MPPLKKVQVQAEVQVNRNIPWAVRFLSLNLNLSLIGSL